MIFRRKKRMVDVKELQRRGVVRIPKQNIMIPTDQNGFVELGADARPISPTTPAKTSSPTNVMDFLGRSGSPESSLGDSAAAVPPALGNRADSERMTELDNKIYKLEQRTELLEKKLDINQSSDSNVGIMGW